MSEDGFAGVAAYGFGGLVAQADQVVPASGLGGGGRVGGDLGVNGWGERDGDAGWARKEGALAQELAGAGHGYGHDRDTYFDCGFEGSQLERADAVIGGEGAFGKDEDGLAAAKNFFHLLGLAKARIRVGAIEPDVIHLFEKC